MRAVATETYERTADDGRVVRATITYRPGPQPVAVRWSAPTVRARSYVAQGAALRTIDAELARGAQDAKDALDGYLVWAAPPHADGRRLVVRSRRLAAGVTVLGNGEPVPWHVARSSGWVLTATGAPIPVETTTPGWLTEAIRATWKKDRTMTATGPVGCDGTPIDERVWDLHEGAAQPYRATYASGRAPAKRSEATTDELVGALLALADRLGDEERANVPLLERRGDNPDDEAARIVAEHGFDGARFAGAAVTGPRPRRRLGNRVASSPRWQSARRGRAAHQRRS